MPKQISSYGWGGGVAILWGETEERSCSKGKKASRMNLERKVEFQGDQSSEKLQQHREQEIGQERASNSFERPFLEES